MCTLTFIPKPQGYLLGMNRDERLTRELAVVPVVINAFNLGLAYPRESSGGTWVGSNSAGITFALLNQNSGANAPVKERSRGEIIPQLLGASRFPEAMRRFQHIDLRGMLPFVLVGFFPAEQIISQCRWDGQELEFIRIGWDVRHWFSSGVSDEMARQVRGNTCYEKSDHYLDRRSRRAMASGFATGGRTARKIPLANVIGVRPSWSLGSTNAP